MNITPLDIPGLIVIEPQLHPDERGYLFESFSPALLDALSNTSPKEKASSFPPIRGEDTEPADTLGFVQENQSLSHQGVLRGLHYQAPPHAQGKLVRVLQGEIWDVAVDLRPGSPTLGQHQGIHLSSHNRLQLWIPEGFAHGFLTLSAHAEVLYKLTTPYRPSSARTLAWNDPKLSIHWPLDQLPPSLPTPILSAADAQGHSWQSYLKGLGDPAPIL